MGAGAEGRQPDTGTPLSCPGRRQPPTRHFLSHAVPRQGLPHPSSLCGGTPPRHALQGRSGAGGLPASIGLWRRHLGASVTAGRAGRGAAPDFWSEASEG